MQQEEQVHSHYGRYVKIWLLLLVLLVVSILGPELEIQAVTLITAFGIAIVKAYIVAAYFMHLNIEKRYISYMLLIMLFVLFAAFFGISVDVMHLTGSGWLKH